MTTFSFVELQDEYEVIEELNNTNPISWSVTRSIRGTLLLFIEYVEVPEGIKRGKNSNKG